jgi:hypothetical protein
MDFLILKRLIICKGLPGCLRQSNKKQKEKSMGTIIENNT